MELLGVTAVVIGMHAVVERVLVPRGVLAKHVEAVAVVGKLWCALYSVASLVGLLWWLLLATHVPVGTLLCGRVATGSLLWDAYFWSKLLEGLFDLTTVTLRFPVNAHFRYHHYTTPVFASLGMMSNASHAFLFMGLNLFMHVMVYAFHAGVHIWWLRPTIRFWQNVQLFGGMLAAAIALGARGILGRPCSPESWLGDAVPPLLFALYYVLFLDELREEARNRSHKDE